VKAASLPVPLYLSTIHHTFLPYIVPTYQLPQEAECFVKAASLPVHKALVWTFLASRSTQRVRLSVHLDTSGGSISVHEPSSFGMAIACTVKPQALFARFPQPAFRSI